MALKFGLMGRVIKEIGRMVKQTEKVSLFMQMEIFTKENGLTTKLAEKEYTIIKMERSMMETG
jgi:hypothetical protein